MSLNNSNINGHLVPETISLKESEVILTYNTDNNFYSLKENLTVIPESAERYLDYIVTEGKDIITYDKSSGLIKIKEGVTEGYGVITIKSKFPTKVKAELKIYVTKSQTIIIFGNIYHIDKYGSLIIDGREIKEVSKVRSVVKYGSTVYAITLDDRLYSWGDNFFGQVGNGKSGKDEIQTTPYEVKEVGKVKSIEVHYDTVYAITLDNRLYSWGDNEYGQVGNGKSGYNEYQTTPYEIKEVGKVKSIKVYEYEYKYANRLTVYAITEDNRLYAWGDNSIGQVGNGESGDEEKQTIPYEVKEVGKVKSIKVYEYEYASDEYAIYEYAITVYSITEDDRLYAWGNNIQNKPYEFKEIGKIKSFEEKAGNFYLSTIDDRLYAWGNNYRGKVGNGEIPYEIKEVEAYKWLEEYNGTFYAITEDDRLYAWGKNGYGQIGSFFRVEYDEITPYEIKEVGKVKSIKVGYRTAYAITLDDRLYAWGNNSSGQVGNGESGYYEYQTTPYEIKEVGKVKSIKVYEYYNYYNEGKVLTIYAITEDDRLYSWGYNEYGQVGNGESGYYEYQTTPYEIKEVGKVKSIEVYNKTVYAITLDDRLYAWGYNIQNTPYEFKEIGKIKSFEEKAGNFYLSTIDDRLFTWGEDGKVGNGVIPYEIKEVEAYKWVEEYNGTFYAITEDDRLYAWGNNYYGQIGSFFKVNYDETTPYEFKEIGKIKSFEEKAGSFYLTTEDDRLYTWGNNRYGQVGNSSTEYQTTPYEIKEVGKVKSVEVGSTVYAITEDDRLYAWGSNYRGKVGNGKGGEKEKQTTPYEIKEVGKVKFIKKYSGTVYVITEDDRLYAWGDNIQNTPYEFKEIGKIKSFEEKEGNFYLSTIDDRLFTWGKDGKVGNGEIPYEIKDVEAYEWVEEYNGTFYAITEDDRLYAWGKNDYGQIGSFFRVKYDETTPYEIKEVGKVKSIKVYNKTVYAITLDNRLYAWGYNEDGQVGNGESGYDEKQTTPYEIKEVGKVKSIEVGSTVYAITLDNRLYAWGDNEDGQVGNGKSGDEVKQTIPYEIKEVGKVKSIEVYENKYKLTFYAITEDDRLYAWGNNYRGQVGNGSSKVQNTPYEVKEVGKVKSIEVYNDTAYAITEDDRLYAWGNNEYGLVGNGSYEKQTTPYEIKEVGKVKSIKVYNKTVYAITEDDRLYAWGYNYYGQVGNGSSKVQTTPYEIKEVGKVKSVKEYSGTVYAITEDDRLYAWGGNRYGEVGNGKSGYNEYQTTPYEIKEVGKVKSIKVYEYEYAYNEYAITVYAITLDNRLYAWGGNRYGQVGNGSYEEEQTTPYEVKEVGKVKSIEVYNDTVYAITEDNRLYAWGNNIQNTPYEFKEIGKIKSFEEKAGNFYLSTIDDRLFTWGKDSKVGNGAIPYEIKEVEAYKWLKEYSGTFYAITEDDRLYAWGNNYRGQVGNGSSKVQTTPYEIKEVGKVKSVKEYSGTVYAITEDDRLYAWGNNEYGLVGNGSYEEQTTPYEIKEVGKVKSIKVYYEYAITVYAITEDDRLYAWGGNRYGQVGNGSYEEEQTTPYEVKEVGKVKSIEVYKNKGKLTVYAITLDDRLYAWCNNIQNTPYEFKKIGKIKSFEEKEGNFYLTTIDDRLFTWGKDGKVGNGEIPYEIKEVEAYKWVEEYNGTFYAITEDDRLYAWGKNDYGQIGSFFKVNYDETTPYEIKEVGKVKSVKEYSGTVYAITEDDRLYAWGNNEYGLVGNGSYEEQTTPYEIKEVGKIKSIEVYEYAIDGYAIDGYAIKVYAITVYAITEDDRLYAWGYNRYGQVGNGSTKLQTTPYEIKEVGKVKSIEVYEYYNHNHNYNIDVKVLTIYAITEDDRLYAWGYNEYGQVGNGSTDDETTPYEIKEVGKVKSIKVYEYEYAITVYAITEDDRLYACGYNIQNTPYEFKEIGKIKSFEEKEGNFYLTTIDDRLFTWGRYSQVGNGAIPYEIKEEGAYKWEEEYDGTFYAITEDDRLYAWGNNYLGQVGNGSTKHQTTPYEVKEVGKVKSIEVYEYEYAYNEYAITVYAITFDNRLYAWGYNKDGQVGNGSSKPQTTPYEIKEVGKVKSIEVYEYFYFNKYELTVYAITEDDRLYAWGYNIQNTPYEFKEIGKIKSFEEKAGNFYLTTIDDRLFTWGKDSKVGNGAIPYEIKEVGAYKWVKEYDGTFYAITEDDRLYAWGKNDYGQIGSFFRVEYDETTPYEVKEIGKIKSFEEKAGSFYLTTEDNRLYAWGDNEYGEVGNGKSGYKEKQTTPYEIKEVGKVKSIEVYNKTVYAITEDDRLYAWGYNIQNTPYEFKEIGKIKSFEEKAGNFYLSTIDDRLFTWGEDGKVGNGVIPYEIKEVEAYKWVEEYNGTFYAITEDDILYAWGNNEYGQVGNGSSKPQTTPYEIKELVKVKSIEVYKNKDKLTVYAITEDNILYAWGNNIQDTPYEFKEIGKIKSFEEKEGNFYLSTIDDRLFTWGKDSKVGNGAIPYEIKEVEAYKWVEEYNGTFYAITEDDRLYAWGSNYCGQVGNGSSKPQTTPYEIKEVGKVKSIEVYEYYNKLTVYAITEDDRLYAWGSNYWCEVGNGSSKPQTTPYELKEVGKVKSIKVYEYEYAITVYAITEDDRLYAWGSNYRCQVGNGKSGDEEKQTTPYEIKEVGKVKSVEVYNDTVYAITEDDRLYAWGYNYYGQVGNGSSNTQTTPYEIKEVGKVKSIKVYEYEYAITVYAITEDDRLYAWGNNYRGQVGNGSTDDETTPYEVKEVGKIKSIEVYYATVYAVTEDDRLYAWGYNWYGQVGNGSTDDKTTPYEIKEVGKVKSIEVGSTVYAITEDDRLYAWGSNIQNTPYEFKEIGKIKSFEEKAGNFYLTTIDDRLFTWGKDGKVDDGAIPYEIKEVEAYKWVEEYNGTFYAITEDNRLYAWGCNYRGQVGNGSTKPQTTPYEIKEVGKVKSIKVGFRTAYAITEDDRLYAWGDNDDGQVGNGSYEKQTTPYEVKKVGKVKSIEVYNDTAYAITEDDRLYAWGYNWYGQVGNGESGYYEKQTTPYEIKEVGKVKSIEVYNDTAYAITEDNRLYAWGDNEYCQVGNGKSGDKEKQTIPYEIKEVGKVKSVEVYNDTSYAITEDNRLYAWGDNEYGQVGNGKSGDKEKQTTPYEIKEVGKVKSIKVYNKTVYAITLDDRLYTWGGNIQNTPYEFKEIGKIKSFEEKEGNFYLTTIDDRLFTWGRYSQVGNGAIPYEIKDIE